LQSLFFNIKGNSLYKPLLRYNCIPPFLYSAQEILVIRNKVIVSNHSAFLTSEAIWTVVINILKQLQYYVNLALACNIQLCKLTKSSINQKNATYT